MAEHRCQKVLRLFPIGLEVAVIEAVVKRDGKRPVKASQIHAGWLQVKEEQLSTGKLGRPGSQLRILCALG
jgi:hypothetical protein